VIKIPRVARVNSETQYYHLMVQGIAREEIFVSDSFKKFYLIKLRDIFKDIGIDILAYCIMSNHAHLLIRCQEIENLTSAMRRLNTTYALFYNGLQKRVGYVFRDRYRSEIIKEESHLLSCIVYIHNNPVKAGICKKPNEYQWSSYKEYIDSGDMINDNELILRGISSDIIQARIIFRGLHNRVYNENWIENKEDNPEYIEEAINDFVASTGEDIETIKNDNTRLYILINYLQGKTNISLRQIARILRINREKLRKIMSKTPSL